MKEQRESYEALRSIAEALAGPTNAMTTAGFLKIAAETETVSGVRAALESAANLLQWYAGLSDRSREILSQATRHPSWPCEGCIRWEAGACNRKIYGGFW